MTEKLKSPPPMPDLDSLRRFTATDVSRRFGAVLSAVQRRGAVLITRRGKPVAVMLSVKRYGESVEAMAAVRSRPRPKVGRQVRNR